MGTRRASGTRHFVLIGSAAVALGACDPDSAERADEVVTEVAALTGGMKPRGLYIPVPDEHLSVSGAVDTLVGMNRRGPFLFAGPGDPPLPIYLNRNGGTYSPGPDDSRNNTSIIPDSPSQVSAFQGSDAQWRTVVTCLTTMFAPYNALIVENEPPSGEYIEAVIGGTPGQVGLPSGVGGVAPIDTYRCRIIPNAIVFAFAGVYGNQMQDVCETAAQEISHALSLDHEFYCPDPMTYLSGCGNKTFRDYDAQCGEYSARACDCQRPSQNSVEVITEKLGAFNGTPPPPPPNDPIAPTVSVSSPANNDTLPSDSTITVTVNATDNIQIASTELVWQYSNATFPCPYNGNGGSVTCARSGTLSTWQIRVGQGDRTFYARARDTAGNMAQTSPLTIHLGTGTPPPPNDNVAPVVSIVSPAPGATLPANSTLRIEADASDNNGLGSVELVWVYTGDTFPCPYNGQGITCTTNNNRYTWNVAIGVGTRRFAVRAIDLSGNTTTTPEQDVVFSTSAPPTGTPGADVVAEDNDNIDQAFPTRCGTAIDLVVQAGDDDWFQYQVAPGTVVEVGVNAGAGLGVGLELFDGSHAPLAASTDVVGEGGSLSAATQDEHMIVRIHTTSPSVPYRLSAVCSTPENPATPTNPPVGPPVSQTGDPDPTGTLSRGGRLDGSCGCSSSRPNTNLAGPMSALLFAAALVLRRRR